MKKIRKVFISSTAYDLDAERRFVRAILDGFDQNARIGFQCFVSDHPDFPISPKDRTEKHSYEICLENVAKSDYFVLLIRNRYGRANVDDGPDQISITHKEFREARMRKIPRFVLVDRKTWDAKQAHGQGREQDFVEQKHLRVFDFIDEIRLKTKGNWIDFFRDTSDIQSLIGSFLQSYDDSKFIGDITIPNGRIVRTGERFIKTWEIENNGLTVWEERFLREYNPGASGLVPDSSLIAIPTTFPGEKVTLSVCLTAPEHPSTCESYWKMVDKTGAYSFPHKIGLNCCVKVI